MAHLLAVTVTLWLAAPEAIPSADATPLPAASSEHRVRAPVETPLIMDWSRPAPRFAAPSTPLPEDISSHPAWERYYRGKKLYGIGQALTATGGVIAGLFVVFVPVALIFDGQMCGGPTLMFGSAVIVGMGVPIVALLYSGISLIVKGKRMRDNAVIEIFGPPDPSRPSVRLELGPGGLGLRGRF